MRYLSAPRASAKRLRNVLGDAYVLRYDTSPQWHCWQLWVRVMDSRKIPVSTVIDAGYETIKNELFYPTKHFTELSSPDMTPGMVDWLRSQINPCPNSEVAAQRAKEYRARREDERKNRRKEYLETHDRELGDMFGWVLKKSDNWLPSPSSHSAESATKVFDRLEKQRERYIETGIPSLREGVR